MIMLSVEQVKRMHTKLLQYGVVPNQLLLKLHVSLIALLAITLLLVVINALVYM